ncbi:M24 family metallopeptidase [Amycolatopsis jejuensis]|uniref:M24 family metallopeptidase n=1 Tax=Amycolatopsis jejuensis TaxID=330084 RepID=UPI000525FB16|nr:M24 family metallopeptidase [Amycolatopsis jejuensis]
MPEPSAEALYAFSADELAKVDQSEVELPFSATEYARRLRTVRAAMAAAGLDVLIVTSPDMLGWLHGLTARVYEWRPIPETVTVVHVSEDPMFHIDSGLHLRLVRTTSCVPDLRVLPSTGLSEFAGEDDVLSFTVEQLRAEGWLGGTIGVERWNGVPLASGSGYFENGLREAGAKVVDVPASIRGARRLKSAEELAVMEKAQAAVDSGLRALQHAARPGMTGLQAWYTYMGGVIEAGGSPSAIHETVFAGPPDAFGHSLSSHRPILDGEYFHADASAAVHQYHARGTRVFSFGPPPAELRRFVSLAAGAYDVVLEYGTVGRPFRELNHALLDYFDRYGLDKELSFGGGYELGLSFPPDFVGEFLWGTHDADTDELIPDGLVSNFESCAFVALIDTVVFQESGTRFLCTLPREILRAGA